MQLLFWTKIESVQGDFYFQNIFCEFGVSGSHNLDFNSVCINTRKFPLLFKLFKSKIKCHFTVGKMPSVLIKVIGCQLTTGIVI